MGLFDGFFKKKPTVEPERSTITIPAALAEIATFWKDADGLPFGRTEDHGHVARLENEFGRKLPAELVEYISRTAPMEGITLENVGNPLWLLGLTELQFLQEGYNFDPITKQVIEDWPRSYFVFGDEGGDLVIIDLDEPSTGIKQIMHDGDWDKPSVVADTIGQFLLCAAARHHALTNFETTPIVDDENGFNLSPMAAKWYFPQMRIWAGAYYTEWCDVFDNY